MERRRSERRVSESARNLQKSAAWAFGLASSLILSAILLTGYLQFLLNAFPTDW
jgi:hypothetical protein